MTENDTDALARRVIEAGAVATAGPWLSDGLGVTDKPLGKSVTIATPRLETRDGQAADNAAFIALTRTAAPTLARACLERGEEVERLTKTLFMAATHCQGGHSEAGQAIANLLGVPFPLRMDALSDAAISRGLDPAELWPWLAEMRQARTALKEPTHG